MEIKTFVHEMDFDALVGEFADGRPVLKIARATVQFVENDPLILSLAKEFQRLIENGAATLCGSLHFFKPEADRELIAFPISKNSVALLLKRNSCRSLFNGGNADVSNIFLHRG